MIHPQFEEVCQQMNLTTQIRVETGRKQLINIKPQNRKFPFIYMDLSGRTQMKCSAVRAIALFGIK